MRGGTIVVTNNFKKTDEKERRADIKRCLVERLLLECLHRQFSPETCPEKKHGNKT